MHLVLDYNGTLALDGELLPDVRERLQRLSAALSIHVVTGDTFGTARARLAGLPCQLSILPQRGQAEAKRVYVEHLGAGCACIGNGRNDHLMLKAAALAIAVVQQEGAWGDTLTSAQVIVRDIRDALDLLLYPQRLVATLRG
ncbi:HAD family hydrolase [Pelomicrobium sp. G1]|jgi:P-type E1-E2 ATPase